MDRRYLHLSWGMPAVSMTTMSLTILNIGCRLHYVTNALNIRALSGNSHITSKCDQLGLRTLLLH
jgi:hypothetical protein